MTTAAGFSATTFSRIDIWPLTSDSDCAPSSGTLRLSSLAALRAPANTVCQYEEVVSLTMTGMRGFWSAAGAVSTTLAKAGTANKALRFRQFDNELKNLIGEEPNIDTQWIQFRGCSVFIMFGGENRFPQPLKKHSIGLFYMEPAIFVFF